MSRAGTKPPCVTVVVLDTCVDLPTLTQYKAAIKALVKQQILTLDHLGLFGLFTASDASTPLRTYIPVIGLSPDHLAAVDEIQPASTTARPSPVAPLLEHALHHIQGALSGRVGNLRVAIFVSASEDVLTLGPDVISRAKSLGVEVDIVSLSSLPLLGDEAELSGIRSTTVANFAEDAKWLTHKYVQQRAKCQCPLVVHELEIPVQVFSKTRRETPAVSFKKLCREERLPDGREASIKNRRIYYLYDEEISAERVIKAYSYGRDLLPVPPAEETAKLRLNTRRELQLIATVNKHEISAHDVDGCVDVVLPEVGNVRAGVALQAFAQALFETESVALARFCFRATAEPKLVMLRPENVHDSTCHLSLLPLGFAEERRIDLFNFSPLPTPSDTQADEIGKFLSLTALDDVPKIGNPLAQRIHQTLFLRATAGDHNILAPPVELDRKFPDLIRIEDFEEPEHDAVSDRGSDMKRISFTSPVKDFLAQVEVEGISACERLERVVRRILENTEICFWQETAGECVCAMREIFIVKKFDASVFNDFLVNLLQTFKLQSEFWKFLALRRVTVLLDGLYEEDDLQIVAQSIGNLGSHPVSHATGANLDFLALVQ